MNGFKNLWLESPLRNLQTQAELQRQVGALHDLPNFSTFHLINPAAYIDTLRNCLAALQELNVIPDAPLEMTKGLEIQASELLLRFRPQLLLYRGMSVFVLATPPARVSVALSDLEDKAEGLS